MAGNQLLPFQQVVNNSSTAYPVDRIAPVINAASTVPTGDSITLSFSEQLNPLTDPELSTLQQYLRVFIDGQQLPPAAISSFSIPSIDPNAPAAPAGMGSLIINFNPDFLVKSGQSVFVAYETAAMTGPLQDANGNRVNNFTQIVNNSSSLFNDTTPPSLSSTQLSTDGKTFTLNFDEPIYSNGLVLTQLANSFRLFVDGADIAATFDHAATQLSADNKSLTIKLDTSRTIEATQQVLLSYSPANTPAASILADAAGNQLASFVQNVTNASAADFRAPQIAGSLSTDPTGIGFNIPFSENLRTLQDPAALKNALTISVEVALRPGPVGRGSQVVDHLSWRWPLLVSPPGVITTLKV